MASLLRAALLAGLALLPALAAAAPAKPAPKAGAPVKPAAEEPGTASTETLKLVDYVLKTHTGDLHPEAVPPYMEVDEKTLPGKLREPYLAKKEELLALKKIAEGKKKPPLRRLGIPEDEKPACEPRTGEIHLKVLKQAGFAELASDEMRFIMERTGCSECELMAEFSMEVVDIPPKKKEEKTLRHYLLHGSDPIWTIVAMYRDGSFRTGTNFFGASMGPKCR